MVRMSNPTHIKITATPREAEAIDRAVRNGHGTSRADFCRLAVVRYIMETESGSK